MSHHPFASRARLAAAWASLLWLSACGAGRFVWVDDYAEAPVAQEATYVIHPADVLNVLVWNQPGISGKVRVREDGKVSLPLLDDVEAAGHTPSALSKRIQEQLQGYVKNAAVTVSLEEARPLQVAVLGEVREPGMKQLEPGAGLLQALALAGGFTDYAREELIFVLRQAPGEKGPPARIRFSYRALIRAEGRAAAFRLRPGDVVVVE